MRFNRSFFVSYEPENCTVEMGTKIVGVATGKASVTLKVESKQYKHSVTLSTVLHVSDFGYSLLSVSAMDKKVFSTSLLHDSWVVSSGCKDFVISM